jgi:UDPglucose 6-dehydrogenase
MKVAMIGCGKLGLPCAQVMNKMYEVMGFDICKNITSEILMADTIEDAIRDSKFIFVAVPTPHDDSYGGNSPIADLPPKDFNYNIVKDVLREINQFVSTDQIVVLISTVLPGTTRKHFVSEITNAKFIYNPYLIAMGSVEWDMINPECIIIGTRDGELNSEAKQLVDFYEPLMENNPTINIGTWDEAEAIKIFYNTFISAKIGLVNMIQDVAEKNGNINVDVVSNALKLATQRITGPKYLTAGMGDGGACHPRDNIALRYLAEKLDLGYDLFHSIMHSRDMQAKNLANRLIQLSKEHSLPVVIHGRAYKPYVSYTTGSYSELVGFFLIKEGIELYFADPETNDIVADDTCAVILMAHNPLVTYYGTGVELKDDYFYFKFGKGSIVVDPWRSMSNMEDIKVIHYGNTRIIR